MRSLRSRLLVAWVLSLAAALGVGAVLVQLYRQSSAAQSGLSDAVLEQGCAAIAENYAYYVAGWAGPREGPEEARFRRDLAAVVGLAMTGRAGLAGGIWRSAGAAEGEALAQEPPADLRGQIAAASAEAVSDGEAAGFGSAEGPRGLACPLAGPVPGLVAWVAHRVTAAPGYREVLVGLGVLLALVLLSAGWLLAALLAWSRRIRLIEAALAGHERPDGAPMATLPQLAATGERELDRIVAALNEAGGRLAEARARSAELSAQVAAAERLAALGRVAAGVAHEIRNPIAAMRLRAENALAGDPARRVAALEAILGQVARLDRLSGELLAMTQRREPEPAPVEVAALLHACAAEQQVGEQQAAEQQAAEQQAGAVRVTVAAPALRGLLDAGLIRRILDNLVQNAIRHTPPGGEVRLSAEVAGGTLRLVVADSGPGVAPELRASLFEPFVTGRPDGTGLGLAIARELAEVQGGSLTLEDGAGEDRAGEDVAGEDGAGGAVFVLEVPWRAC